MKNIGLMVLKSTFVAALAAAAFSSGPRAKTLCAGFLPKNSMRIPVGDVHALGIEETMFNSVLDRVQEVYGPIVASHGGKLVINRLWEDATVNASAEQLGGNWIINMYGGLARHKAVTEDGFALVACHELGHHLGGFPRIEGDEWATNEGGADYYSSLKCARRILSAKAPALPDPIAVKGCSASYAEGADRNRCESSAMAGISLSSLLAELGQSPQPKLATPDPSAVKQMDDSHPAAQCRLDTYYQAALCTKPLGQEQSNTEPAAGACTKSQGFTAGIRPLCWYKPPSAEAELRLVASRQIGLDEKAVEARIESLRTALAGGGK